MTISFLEIFTLISIIHCFLLSLILLLSKYLKSETNNYLGFTLFILSVIGINNWFWDLNQSPIIINISDLFLWQFLYPATLLIYFNKSIQKVIKKKSLILLFAPFVLLSVFNIVITLQNIYNLYQIPFLSENLIATFYKAISFLSIIYPLIIFGISYKILFIDKTDTKKNWLKLFWILFFVVEAYGILLEFHRFLYLERKPLTYLWLGLSIFLYWLIYIGVYKYKLSNEQFEIKKYLSTKKTTSSKEEIIENKHIQELIRLINTEKIHHNSQLNREIVAEKLGISSGYLSQIIKLTQFNNLTSLINHYRVEDIKQMLLHPDFSNYNLLSIGLEVGFNSKATFYSSFKKITGMTPNEYKKQQL